MNLDKLETSIKLGRGLIIATLIILPASYYFWFGQIQGFPVSDDTSHWGQFGDFIGGILNPLIAIFAVYWLSVSILIQKQELSETRTALEETQKAQERQAELAVVAARIQSLNMRMTIIGSKLAAKLEYRNIVLNTNRPNQPFLNEEGRAIPAKDIIAELNPEIRALEESQTGLIRDIEELLNET